LKARLHKEGINMWYRAFKFRKYTMAPYSEKTRKDEDAR